MALLTRLVCSLFIGMLSMRGAMSLFLRSQDQELLRLKFLVWANNIWAARVSQSKKTLATKAITNDSTLIYRLAKFLRVFGAGDYVVEGVLSASGDCVARDDVEATRGLDHVDTEISCSLVDCAHDNLV